jgi:hypothetical protein
MVKSKSFFITIIIFLVLTFGTSCSLSVDTGSTLQIATLSPTKSPQTATATQIPPTSTATNLPSPTAPSTPTKAPSATLTFSQTPTLEPATLILTDDTVCMVGANFSHIVEGYVTSGTQFPIIGKLDDQSWWLVEMEDDNPCWVNGAYTSVRGGVENLPVLTPPPIPSETPTATPTNPGIYYILIAKDTGGPYGCGDSLIRYYPGVWVKGDMSDDIKGALNALFANHNEYIDGLYNPIFKSDLKAKSVDEVSGEVIVRLAGNFVRPKDNCESQRMHAQIWYTVSQFSPTRAIIYLNNALLGDLLVVAK